MGTDHESNNTELEGGEDQSAGAVWIRKLIEQEQLPDTFFESVIRYYITLAKQLAAKRSVRAHPLIVGINGAQGTGKSTLALFLKELLERDHRMCTTIISIDDLYLSQAERARLAEGIHPLLRTRGVPGTHHVAKGLTLLRELRAGKTVTIPRFDKATDNPKPESEWETSSSPSEIVLFEGWCIGARPQSADGLEAPVNGLEAREDSEGSWRRYVNAQLEQNYAKLFAELDVLIHVHAPSFEQVFDWRKEQERKLAEHAGKHAPGVMDDNALERFIMHYERLTRWMLSEMPARADFTLRLNTEHAMVGLDLT
jgi:D-glycerate 3-kinase